MVQWVLEAAAAARVYRTHFAVQPEAGGDDGVLEAFLMKDRGVSRSPPRPSLPVLEASVVPDVGVPDLAGVYAAFRAYVKAGGRTVALDTPPPYVHVAGHIVRVLDVALRAGAKRALFGSAPAPKSLPLAGAPPDARPGSLPWLRAWVAQWKTTAADGFVVKFGRNRYAASPDARDAASMPPPPPRRRRTASAAEDPDPLEEEEPPIFEEEVPPEAEDVPTEDVDRDDEPSAQRAPRAFAYRVGAQGGAADPAVDAALRWLAARQTSEGGWACEAYDRWCNGEHRPGAATEGVGQAEYDVGVTGLALLAFLGAGYTQRADHAFGEVVARGLRYLRKRQDVEGCFGPRSPAHATYTHAIAALAMVEAYGMTGSAVLQGSAQRALDFIAACRNPGLAWRYGVRPGDNDTSVTGWMAMVLHSARAVNRSATAAGRTTPLSFDEGGFDGIRAWLDKATDATSGRVGYQQRGGGPARPPEIVDRFPADKSESMTATGLLLRSILGADLGKDADARKAVQRLRRLPPTWDPKAGTVDFCYWHAGTLAMHQVGGDAWKAWHAALRAAVVPRQRTDGDACGPRGSWDPIDPWAAEGGRVYATAILAGTLLAPHRYERVGGAK